MNLQENTQCAGKTHAQGDSSSKHGPLGYGFGAWCLHCPVRVSVLDHVSPAEMTKPCPDLASEMGCGRHVMSLGAIGWNLVGVLSSLHFEKDLGTCGLTTPPLGIN